MKRVALTLIPLLALLAACPGDKKAKPVAQAAESTSIDTAALDTAKPVNLATVKPNIPPASPDTFKVRRTPPSTGRERAAGEASVPSYPTAPAPLMDAVQREQSFSKFCYQEFGQKSDPTLVGNVAMVITVGRSGIDDARVGDSNWSSSAAGHAVDRCLDQKAPQAWRLAPGAVKPGKYVVQLSFRGS